MDDIERTLWGFVERRINRSDFERWAYETAKLAEYLGPSLHMRVISTQFSNASAAGDLRLKLREWLMQRGKYGIELEEDEASGLAAVNGISIPGWIAGDRRCSDCEVPEVFHEAYDSYFCPRCNEWTEREIEDPEDPSPKRPDIPLPLFPGSPLGQEHIASSENLIRFLRGGDPPVRQAAAWALVRMRSADVLEALEEALTDGEFIVRDAAGWALGRIGEPAIEILLTAANHRDAQVRHTVAWSLGLIGDQRVVKALICLLADEAPEIRKAAAAVLGNRGAREALEPLTVALNDEDPGVRWSSAYALGRFEDERAVGPLMNTLEDDDPNVRGLAASALGDFGDERVVGPLHVLLQDEDEWVRQMVAQALDKIRDRCDLI